MMAKTWLGCLPIRLEISRYGIPRLPEEERLCLICRNFNNPTNEPTLEHLESEIHYSFFCRTYRRERDEWLQKQNLPVDFDHLALELKLKTVLNDACNVKFTAQFITKAYNIRSRIINQK